MLQLERFRCHTRDRDDPQKCLIACEDHKIVLQICSEVFWTAWSFQVPCCNLPGKFEKTRGKKKGVAHPTSQTRDIPGELVGEEDVRKANLCRCIFKYKHRVTCLCVLTYLKGGCSQVGVSLCSQATTNRTGDTALKYARGDWGWTLGGIFSQQEWLDFVTGYPGRCRVTVPEDA